jgi:flagellum-specific peptidoglycan hydrolase FlgJ
MPATRAEYKEENEHRKVTYHHEYGTTIHKGGSRSWRNNNPGNVVGGPGMIGKDKDGFAIFPDVETGERARRRMFEPGGKYYGYGSIREVLKGKPDEKGDTKPDTAYAPKGDGNNPEKYADFVRNYIRKKLAIDVEGIGISDYTPEMRAALEEAQKQYEGFKPGDISDFDKNGQPVLPYEPGPYNPTPTKPGTEGPDAQAGRPENQRTAQAPTSGTTATQQMSYRQAPAGSDPYDDLYDFSPPGRESWGALPDHIRDWLFPEPGSVKRPIGPPIAQPKPYYPIDPGFSRFPIERPPRPEIAYLPYYEPRANDPYMPRPYYPPQGDDPRTMHLPYYPRDRGSFRPAEAIGYDSGEDPENTDASQPARKSYTIKDKFDFLKDVYNEAKPVSERTGLSLPFIIGHAATETGWGKWLNGNNLFNLEAGRDLKGPTMEVDGKTIRAYPSYKESMKDYIAHFRNTPGYTDLFEPETRTNARRLADAIQNGGFRASDPLYAKKIMLNVEHPLIMGYGAYEE